MNIDLYISIDSCRDLAIYLEKLDIELIGIEQSVLEKCLNDILSSSNTIPIHERVIVPRIYHESSQNRLLPHNRRRALPLCKPDSLSTARLLAKLKSLMSIAVTPSTLRYVDESQINVLTQVRIRKYLEVLLSEFLLLVDTGNVKAHVEKYMYFLGDAIEYALKRDVGVIVSSGSRRLVDAIHPRQIDAVLKYLGFTKRERNLMLVVYPMEILKQWLGV